jgi:signal transduction histidine kinase/ActR/RegA family two-component response regulator
VPGKAAAEQSGNPVLKVRATAMVAHILPERSLSALRATFAAIEADGQAAEVAHLRPLLAIEERSLAEERGDQETVLACESTMGEQAGALGDRRLQALVAAHRANRLYRQKRHDEAMPIYQEVAELYDRLGDLRQVFGIRNMLTWAAMNRGELALAGELAEQNRALLHGRGYVADDKDLLRTRFELALRNNDSELALELRRQWDAHDGVAAAEERRATELRARIRDAEAERSAAERRLAEERAAADERLRSTRTAVYGTALLGLTLLVAVTWHSRRRLLHSHGRLAEQVRRVEAGERVRAQLEARMRELERAESLGTMAAGVAHDFNNLLTSMLGNADLLRQRAVVAEDRELLDTIVTAGQQAGRLCKQLQQYAGGELLRPEALDLVRVVNEMMPVLQAAARANVHCEARPPALDVMADRGQLEQMLLNLVVNATDAGAHEVKIEIDVARGDGSGPWARLTVSDDGHGMTDAVRQRIFDPFFTTRFPGRGLGLAVVYGAVRRHGGTIEVDSELGRGTTFTIRLPMTDSTIAAAVPVVQLPSSPPRTGSRMFVVDDEAHVRVLLVRMLANLGRTATAVADGHELLRLLATLPTDETVTVFVDLTMPEMDGAEVTRRIRAQRPGTRIVLISGHTEDHLMQVSETLQPDGVLAKPFRADLLAQVLQRAAPTVASGD